ncbi:hypothetical protein BDV26DRAFT_287222 [Aspergillus bertholletiae]|uniref:Uncharacterized protein n=1 Tax=Aspergillus bertholletiae TaxID=1226010 RepID=A0A5N7BPN7_9EURO|nr:hypothetical protein BDV26DRAFT_287222 [Aspergillus bertholletiae]
MRYEIAWDANIRVHNSMDISKSATFCAWDFARVWDGRTMYIGEMDYSKWTASMIERCGFNPVIHSVQYTVFNNGMGITGTVTCEAHWHYAIRMNLGRGVEFKIVPLGRNLTTKNDGRSNGRGTNREGLLDWVDDQYVYFSE